MTYQRTIHTVTVWSATEKKYIQIEAELCIDLDLLLPVLALAARNSKARRSTLSHGAIRLVLREPT